MNKKKIKIIICILFITIGLVNVEAKPINNDKTSLSSKGNIGRRLQECAIWGGESNLGIQQYVVFRRTFSIDNVSKAAQINIFADARYLLWINGHYIMRGPCRFNPSRPEYDMCNIAHYLHPGKNTIAVLVHYYGNCINGRIMKGQPTLSLCLCDAQTHKEFLTTDILWKYTNKTCYQAAPESWNTVIDHIDGRIDGAEWTQVKYDDSSWGYAQYIDTSKLGQFMPNELPLPREKELTSLHQLPSGSLLDSYLPTTLKQGQELIVDYGIMTLAYTKIKLEATTNSVLSIRYALRYQEGKTFEEFGSGNRYTARSGMQEFMTTDQWGSHYMILRCDSGEVVIHGLKIIERVFPYKRSGSFVCNDTLLNDLWKMSINTIEATSDDAYGTDARERNEWIQDAIKASFLCSQVALARPDGSGKSEMRLLKNMIRHAALSQLPDGRIRATFPTDRGDEDCHYFIDDYACQWFEALHTYLNMTGDIAFAQEMFAHLKAQIGWFEKQKRPNGLYLLREYTSFDNPFAYITCEGTTVNGFYYQALTHASYIAHILGEDEQARCYEVMRDDLYKHFNHILWDEQAKAYHSAIWNDTLCAPTVHAQLIALQSGIVPPERISSTRKWLFKYYRNHSMFHCCTNNDVKHMVEEKCGIGMPIVYYWLFNELYKANTSKYDIEALNEMRSRWKYMVLCQKDIGTLSESFVNALGERPSQSCHNYGVIPAYYLSSYVLGVRCEKPIKAKEIVIEPRLGDLQFARGAVVTAYGLVKISWNCTASKDKVYFSISLPKGISAVLRLPTSKYQLSSFKHEKAICVGRWTVLKNIRGTCSGSFCKN
jgi:Alpha-L-rhamnosidase N-terminal domain./Bacterial alpha-L-rhamnosidase.